MSLIDVFSARHGFYKVGDVIHSGKVAACVDGTLRNIHPQWIFHQDVFEKVNWEIEPSESIMELYRQRAQQLRDKYDYIIIKFSGGSDSTNILETFLSNNIKVDEIFVSWPLSLMKSFVPDFTNYSFDNVLSEWYSSVKPKLDWLKANHPEIKITINDWTTRAKDFKIEDDFALTRNQNLTVFCDLKWSDNTVEELKNLVNIKNPGIICGTDKPKVCIADGEYKIYFLDSTVSSTNSIEGNKKDDPSQHEFFYWSPDATKLLTKQAHLIVKFFEANPGFKHFINWPIHNPLFRNFYETATRPIIYPHINQNYFQANKPRDMTLAYDVVLFQLGFEDLIRGKQKEVTQFLQSRVDEKYLQMTDGFANMKGMITPMWKIKKA